MKARPTWPAVARELWLLTIQHCPTCKSIRIVPRVQPDHTIPYQCLECGRWVTEPTEV